MDKKIKTSFYDNGTVESVYTVTDEGITAGPFEKYYENGQLREKGTFKGRHKFGDYEEYYENGQLKEKGTWGLKKENYERYYENGQLEIRENGNLLEEYYENGQLKRHEKDGVLEEYDENGRLECRKKDGVLEFCEVYHKNGQLACKADKTGLVSYSENGVLTRKETIINKEEKVVESYHENGQLWEKICYKNGKWDGPYEQYNQDGKLKRQCVFKNGKELGYEDGKAYLEKWKEKQQERQERKGLCARLDQMSNQMAPTQLRKEAKRELVKDFRKMYPKKGDSR